MDSSNGISILLSQQMLDAIKHIADDSLFLSGRQHRGALCIQHSPTAWKMRFSCFPVLPGSAHTQSYLRWHSKVSFDCLLYR